MPPVPSIASSIDEHVSPNAAGAGRRSYARRAAPYLLAVAACLASPALPHSVVPNDGWWLAAVGFVIILVLIGRLAASRPAGHWLYTLAPLLLLPAVQALRAADGNGVSGFTPMLILPTIWFALHGRLRDVVLSIVGGTLVLVLPVLVVGAPRYPSASWRFTTLFVVVLTTVGLLVHRLVQSSRRTALAAELSSARFRALFEDAPVGLALSGEHIHPDITFLLVNKALCAMLGVSRDELCTARFSAVCHPDDLAAMTAEVSDDDHWASFEARLRHRSGRDVWAAVSRTSLPGIPGQQPQLAWQFRDVTASQETDRALLDALDVERAVADRLRELNRTRSELVSSVSHDLRTPITSARGYAELLVDGDLGQLTDEQSAIATTIARSLTRLTVIIDELVDLPGAGDSAEPETVHTVDLRAVLDDALQVVAIQATLRGQLLCYTSTLPAASVAGNAVRLERALVNLLGNAIKFTSVGGRVSLDARAEDGQAVITISDTGAGIAPEDQERIFQRFYRAPREGTDAVSGTGLGLAIVAAIVTQHGGTIEVRSYPGQGSAFVVRLPCTHTVAG